MWTGQALIRPGWAVFRGTAGDHARHRHHAVQIAVGINGPVELWAERPGLLSAPAAVIAADCFHQIASGPEPVILIYVERESKTGRALDQWCDGQVRALSLSRAQVLAELMNEPANIEGGIEKIGVIILESAASPSAERFHDQRIARSIESLPRPLPGTLNLANVATQAGLSSSRYAHLFKAHTGMPLRPYLRWWRLQQALAEIARGANLTEAAYAAGFSDSAHLSRSFRRTFGVAPNILLHSSLALSASVA